jgi:hypothetical protein
MQYGRSAGRATRRVLFLATHPVIDDLPHLVHLDYMPDYYAHHGSQNKEISDDHNDERAADARMGDAPGDAYHDKQEKEAADLNGYLPDDPPDELTCHDLVFHEQSHRPQKANQDVDVSIKRRRSHQRNNGTEAASQAGRRQTATASRKG